MRTITDLTPIEIAVATARFISGESSVRIARDLNVRKREMKALLEDAARFSHPSDVDFDAELEIIGEELRAAWGASQIRAGAADGDVAYLNALIKVIQTRALMAMPAPAQMIEEQQGHAVLLLPDNDR